MLFKNISIKDIDFSCDFFKFLPVDPSRQKILFQNIKKNGILYPPVLIKDNNLEKFIVVNGFKRLFSALKLEKESVNALVMDYSPQSFLKGFYLRAAEKNNEIFDESLKFYAQSKLYQIILNIKNIFPEFDFELIINELFGNNKNFINKIIKFSNSPFFVQKAFFEGKIALPVLFDVLKYKENEIKDILYIFNELSPGLNRQREIISLADELSHRDDKTISEIICQDDISQILKDEKLPNPQKLSFVINSLNLKRYPEMINLKEKFEILAHESGFNENPRIFSPKNFEDSDFKIEFKFNSVETYVKVCKKINKSLEKGYIERFLNFI
ncbi:MAG: hypothetical protein RBR08_00835 [Desulforegulaceae bacterium]|nr:hypothetical protein [Desulforegulaceae bacterium]